MTKNKKIGMLSIGAVVAVTGISTIAITNINKNTNENDNINNHSIPTIGNYSARLKPMNLPSAAGITNKKIDTINKYRPLLQGLRSGKRSQIFKIKMETFDLWVMEFHYKF